MPYRTIDDRIDGLVMTFSDISGSKQLENALRENGSMFKSFFNSTVSAIITISQEGVIFEFNAPAEIIYGKKREDAVGRDYYSLLDSGPEREKVREKIVSVALTGQPVKFETGLETGDITSKVLKWQANRMKDEKGGVAGIIIFEQRRNREKE
jgi:two-component system CheB/CheR fusion protein